jgi:membrane-bound lytic murein transglycosylase D
MEMIAQVKSIGFKASLAYCFLVFGQPAAKSQTLASAVQIDKKKEDHTTVPQFTKADTTAFTPQSYVQPVYKFTHVITSLPEKLIKDQFRCMETTIAMPYNSKVQGFINYYTARDRRFVSLMLERTQLFFPIYEEALERHGLPDELKYLSMVESSLNPRAISPVKAAGLWQFMSVTGRYYDLRQDAYIDERLDPYKATDAACRYLKELHDMFGDWHLALAAYNCGPGNVRKAIRHSGNKKSFWQIYNFLPAETRAYVPKFIALNYVMKYAEAYNITTQSPAIRTAADTILVNQYVNMNLFALQLGISAAELQELNPQYKRNFVPAYGGQYSLRIPADKKEYVNLNRYAILSSSVNSRQKLVYRVDKGEVIAKIAQQHKVSVEDLKRWNQLKSNQIAAGQQLTIWVNNATYPITNIASNRMGISNRIGQVVSIKTLPVPQIKRDNIQTAAVTWKISQTMKNEQAKQITKLYRLKIADMPLAKK